jgi:nitroreductase
MSAATPSNRNAIFDVIRTRRVVRSFTDDPVPTDLIREMIEAGRWASSASNRRLHRFHVVRDPARLRLVKAMSPGLRANPSALIVICTDLDRAEYEGVRIEKDATTWIDVGTAAMNMMNAGHALGLGSCPVTGFSRSGVRVVLDLQPTVRPELILMLGFPAKQTQKIKVERLNVDDVIDWEVPGGRAEH